MTPLFYGFQFPHHGCFSAFSALSREMQRNNVRVGEIPYPSVPPFRPNRVRTGIIDCWWRLHENIVRDTFLSGGLVHYFFAENTLYRGHRWKQNGKMVLSIHQPFSQFKEMTRQWMHRSLVERIQAADAIVLMSSHELDAYQKLAPNSNVLCIPHGVDIDFFSSAGDKEVADDPFRVLTVGNWLRDYDLWAKVVDRVVSECPQAEFSIIANPDTVKKAVSSLTRGKKNVRILKDITDEQLLCEYRRTDVVFLPLTDAWANNALLESMACGCPVVVTDLPAVREYAADTVCYIQQGNVENAAFQLLNVLNSPEKSLSMAQRARLRIQDGYSWQRVAGQYLDLYKQV